MRALYAAALVATLVMLGGGGHLLSRLDMQQKEMRALAARQRLFAAELELTRILHRDIKPANVIVVDQLCRDRVEALRDGLRVLQRVGKVEIEDFPGMRWRNWE